MANPTSLPSSGAANVAEQGVQAARGVVACTLKELLFYFLRLGATGFGGPVAFVGYMQRDLVEERRWISEDEYKEGLALAQLAPGPLVAQLAIYLGWVRGGVIGATLIPRRPSASKPPPGPGCSMEKELACVACTVYTCVDA